MDVAHPSVAAEARVAVAEQPRSRLGAALLATLAYHDLLNLPLTAVACWRYLVRPLLERRGSPPALELWGSVGSEVPALREVERVLQALVEQRTIETKNGFYFFPGRESLFGEWIAKHARSQAKWKRLRRIVSWWQTIPFLRGVAGTGSLSFDNANVGSDLDVLVIAAPNRVWTVRFLLTVLLDVFHLRRRPRGLTRDRVCLNHYLAEDALTFPYRSLYTAMEYARLVPIFGEETCWRFRRANRAWMAAYLVQVLPDTVSHLKAVPESPLLRRVQGIAEYLLGGVLGDRLEQLLARFQRARIARAGEADVPGGRVIATDARAEFHPYSKEAPLLSAFNARMEALGLAEMFGRQRDSGLAL